MQVRPGRGQQLLREKAAEIETHLSEIKRLQVCLRMQPFLRAIAPLAEPAWLTQQAVVPGLLTCVRLVACPESCYSPPVVIIFLRKTTHQSDCYIPVALEWP